MFACGAKGLIESDYDIVAVVSNSKSFNTGIMQLCVKVEAGGKILHSM